MLQETRLTRAIGLAFGGLSLLASGAALAQNNGGTGTDAGTPQRVIVTGSNVPRMDAETPTMAARANGIGRRRPSSTRTDWKRPSEPTKRRRGQADDAQPDDVHVDAWTGRI